MLNDGEQFLGKNLGGNNYHIISVVIVPTEIFP